MCCKYISIVACPIKVAFGCCFFLIITLFLTISSTRPLSLRGNSLFTFFLYSTVLRASMRDLRVPFLFHYLLIIMFIILFDRLFFRTIVVLSFLSNWLIRFPCHFWLCIWILFFNNFINIVRFLRFRIELSLNFVYSLLIKEGEISSLMLSVEEMDEKPQDHQLSRLTWNLKLRLLTSQSITFQCHIVRLKWLLCLRRWLNLRFSWDQ